MTRLKVLFTPQSSISILSYISSFLAYFFSMISSEESFRAAMMKKSKKSSPPRSGDTEAVFPEALLKSWTSLVFFVLLGPGVSCSFCVVSGLSLQVLRE
jgi:hypothetical protein